MSFKGKVVIITGSSSGIGASAAISFAKEGADVVIVGRNDNKLKKVASDCAKTGRTPLVIKADVTKDNEAKSIIDKTISKFGKIDVLVNNAGMLKQGSILDGTLMESYDVVMSTNLRPVFYLTMLAAPHLVKTKGNIVNISSVAGSVVISPQSNAYCTSKAAMDHFSRIAAVELAPHGVRVNAINPGPVKTDIVSDEQFEEFAKTTLLKRVSDSEETADLIMYLASDKARSMTGGNYFIDNGWNVKPASYD